MTNFTLSTVSAIVLASADADKALDKATRDAETAFFKAAHAMISYIREVKFTGQFGRTAEGKALRKALMDGGMAKAYSYTWMSVMAKLAKKRKIDSTDFKVFRANLADMGIMSMRDAKAKTADKPKAEPVTDDTAGDTGDTGEAGDAGDTGEAAPKAAANPVDMLKGMDDTALEAIALAAIQRLSPKADLARVTQALTAKLAARAKGKPVTLAA